MEQQESWFNKISKSNDHYLIIEYKGFDIGMIYTSNFNIDLNTLETNIIIGEKPYHDSGIALKACLLFTNYLLGNYKNITLLSTVSKENKNTLDLDAYLGFKVYKEDDKYSYSQLDYKTFRKSKGFTQLGKLNAIKFEPEESNQHIL